MRLLAFLGLYVGTYVQCGVLVGVFEDSECLGTYTVDGDPETTG